VIKLNGIPIPGGTATGIGIADSIATIKLNIVMYMVICSVTFLIL